MSLWREYRQEKWQKKGIKYEMKEFFQNFAIHWFNLAYIKTNRHIQNRYFKYKGQKI